MTRRTITNKNLIAISTKVAVQMNCKLGGFPWSTDIAADRNLTNTMVVGFDVCHDKSQRGKDYGKYSDYFQKVIRTLLKK